MTDAGGTAVPPAGLRRRRKHVDWPGLWADVRAAVFDATLALALTGAVFAWLYARVENGTSDTLDVIGFPPDASRYWMYWMCQAFGWSGLLWAYLTMVFGLLRSGSRPSWPWLTAARVEKWHRTTSLTTVALMFMHAFMLFTAEIQANFDGLAFGDLVWTSFLEAFVPGGYTGAGYTAMLIGLLAFYLAIPLGLAFYFRRTTGSRLWRALHRFIIVVYVLSVWHTLLYGTNVWYDGSFRTLVWVLQIPLAVLVLVRLRMPARRGEALRLRRLGRTVRPIPLAARLAGRLVLLATVAGLAAIVITGVDGGRDRKGPMPELWPKPWVIWVGLGVLVLVLVAVVHRLRPARLAAVRATDAVDDDRAGRPQAVD